MGSHNKLWLRAPRLPCSCSQEAQEAPRGGISTRSAGSESGVGGRRKLFWAHRFQLPGHFCSCGPDDVAVSVPG